MADYEFDIGGLWKVGILAIVALLVLAVANPIRIVPAGHRGVLLTWGAVTGQFDEGIHFVTPVAQDVQLINVQTLKYTTTAAAFTKDLLDVKTDVAINYHIIPGDVGTLYNDIGLSYEDKVIAPAEQEVIKATTARFNAQELVSQREFVKGQIEEALKGKLANRSIVIESISITNFEFPAEFQQAITDKQTAGQLKLKAENDLQRIQVEAQQTVAKATGESQAIEIINQQLVKSPQYVQYMAVQKWNGVLPLATGSGAMPFIGLSSSSTSSQATTVLYNTTG
jgi:prohibitin 2